MGHGSVVYGIELTFQGLKLPIKSLVLLVAHCGLAGVGEAYDRSRRFAIAIFGALSPGHLTLPSQCPTVAQLAILSHATPPIAR